MKNEEFLDRLCTILGMSKLYVSDWAKRKAIITITKSNYGTPSSAVIEFEGSPARCPIFVGDLSYSFSSRTLCVNGKFYRSIEKKVRACELIDHFIRVNHAD